MNDDRFDRDLRAVLSEDGPAVAPEDLHRRVASIPDEYPTRPGRRARGLFGASGGAAWRLAIVGAVGVVIVGFALSRGWFGIAPGIGGQATPTASTGVSPTATVPVGGTACLGNQLTATITSWQGAAGSRIADVALTGPATGTCLIQGTPGLTLVDAHGVGLIDSSESGPSGRPHVASGDPIFELKPGQSVKTQVRAANYCGGPAATPVVIVFTLPNDAGTVTATPAFGVPSSEAVPPCSGSTGGLIEMNGWTR